MPSEHSHNAPPSQSALGSNSLWGRMDRSVRTAAANFHEIAIVLVIIGLMLAVASFLIDVMSVTFDGKLKGGAVIDPPKNFTRIVSKQVGFGYAPNWLLTGFLFLPYAVMQALRARSAIERVIDALIEQRMLVTLAFEAPNREEILESWNKRSRRMMPVVSLVALTVFGLVVYDFMTVVAQWTIASEAGLRELAEGVTLHHKDYEFDWSVAATFEATKINPWVNVIFAGLAYLYIAAFGTCFLLAAFFYFTAVGGFFSKNSLARQNLRLIPNPRSADARCGFEVFEEFFNPFIQAAMLTAVIAFTMYLQNIYLRAPVQADIFTMILEPIQIIVENLIEFSEKTTLGDLTNLRLLTDITVLSGYEFIGIPLQVWGGSIMLLLIVMLVFGFVWATLRDNALSGAHALAAHGVSPVAGVTYTDNERARIHHIQVWPLSWISMNLLLACIVLVIASLWWPRLITLIVALIIVRVMAKVIGTIRGRR